MKKINKTIILGALAVTFLTTGVFASTTETVVKEEGRGRFSANATKQNMGRYAKRIGFEEIAKDPTKFAEFKQEILKRRKECLDQIVKDGKMTQAEADKEYETLKVKVEALTTSDIQNGKTMREILGTPKGAPEKGMNKGRLGGLGKGQMRR